MFVCCVFVAKPCRTPQPHLGLLTRCMPLRCRPARLQVAQPFDDGKFNFKKALQKEVLFMFEPAARRITKPAFQPAAAPRTSPSLVYINVSPIEYGHVLLVSGGSTLAQAGSVESRLGCQAGPTLLLSGVLQCHMEVGATTHIAAVTQTRADCPTPAPNPPPPAGAARAGRLLPLGPAPRRGRHRLPPRLPACAGGERLSRLDAQ